MKLWERFFHASLFEISIILFSVIAISKVTDHSNQQLTIMLIGISLVAMLWNMVFNWIFDFFATGAREKRSIPLRIFHTFAFELGLLAFSLPWIAYILQISWLNAFYMDMAMTFFILLYTFVFNWLYDHLRAMLLRSHQKKT